MKATKKQYAILILAAYLFLIVMSVINKDLPNAASEIGEFVGKGIGLILIPLIVMRISDYAGWGLFFAIAFGYSYGELNKPGYSNVTYQAPGCEFFVKFPEQPQIKQFTHPSIGEYEQAHWGRTTGTESVSLRTECINMPEKQNEISEKDAEKAIKELMVTYAKDNGLKAPTYRYKKTSIGHSGEIRGIKHVQEVPVTFEILLVLGDTSLISIYAGGTSETYPQKEIYKYLLSVNKY